MEHRHASLFRVVFTPSCLVLFLYCARVRSAPVTPSVVDVMKNDTRLCATARFLYDSEYVKPCGVTAYPTASITYSLETLNNFLCLGVYDTAYKICQYSSQLQTPLNSTFDSYVRSIVDKYTPNDNKAQEDFCKGLQGFRSQYEKVDSLLKQLVRSLNTPHACEKVCFDLDDKFRPLCAVLAWIKNNDDAMSAKRTETKYDPAALDKPFVNHDEMTSNEKTTLTESKKIEKLTESKKIEKEEKEPKEQNEKQVIIDSNNDNVKEGDSNVPGNAPIAENVKFDEEKIKSDTDKANNSQKKINNTLEKPVQKSVPSIFKENRENTDTELDTNAAIEKSIKDIPPSDDSQGVSINKPINNINKNVVNEGIADKSNKEQSITDSKPSTLSENTQDHYDAENPEENMENDIDGINNCKLSMFKNIYSSICLIYFSQYMKILNKSNKNKLEVYCIFFQNFVYFCNTFLYKKIKYMNCLHVMKYLYIYIFS